MKRSDDVFFFTLIDFLVQVFFFGLVLYVLGQSTQANKEREQKEVADQIKKLLDATGVSTITELTDDLTNMAPIDQLKGMADFINRNGGVSAIKNANEVVRDAGGMQNLKAGLMRLKKLEDGLGKPPCLFDVVGEKKVVKPLATVVATDTTIEFQSEGDELRKVLELLNVRFSAVRELSLSDFRRTFSPIIQHKSDCRYTLRFLERTRIVDARDAARFAFYLNIEKP
ncbi:hypothetical protein Q4S45_04590 [Massilia sp. R2A-15]|uniref:hypothetical protein n=1 Tax=Massilia sp. R2A-15 TaxID=3064278 RepID=UPI0027370100|nr:hypothetical protein [Massilia sp. R2A-15]WLI90405.1 hypothetical protein Q4S45_04590 [Massilia sp. R2A-15]